MNAITMRGIICKGRVEVEEPIKLPDGTEVLVTPTATRADDDGPMTSDEIARVLAALEKIQPFEMTPEEEAAIEAGRQKAKAYTIANMHKGIEDLFP